MHIKDIDVDKLSPMMKEYIKTKTEVGEDCILLYRLGDFFEIFFEDAELCSRELELTLTGKQCGLDERAPMCGVPFHAIDNYVNKLVKRGYKVALCDQVEDPKLAKGLVKRAITQLITPGTNISTALIEENQNNYIMSICHLGDRIGIAVADVTTGDFMLSEVFNNRSLMDEIYKFSPSEIICNESFLVCGIDIDEIKNRIGCFVTALLPHFYDDDRCKNAITSHFHVNTVNGLGIADFPCGITSAGAMLMYLTEMQKSDLSHFTHIYPYATDSYMLIDSSTRRNLELLETMRDKQKRGSLLWVLDKTKTAMGSRLLSNYIRTPLVDRQQIEDRLCAVEMLCKSSVERDEIREYLNAVYDLERLIGKVNYKTIRPIDMIALKNSLKVLPYIKMLASKLNSALLDSFAADIDELQDIYNLIDQSILEEPCLNLREGGIIRDGFSEDIDKLKKAKREGKTWLAELEAQEKNNTGIPNLKIKYNHVFGYFFEITNAYKDKIPEYYIRKQTLTNAERCTTPKLKELEDIILNSEERLVNLEYEMYCNIRDHIAGEIDRIQKTAKAIAGLDATCSLSLVAERNNYVKPKLNDKGIIKIEEGRHPVVEKMTGDLFIPNDTLLDNGKNLISIITGPNMAGKSTYMRQTALIVLMAQMGSFVPAASANIGIVDRIFTRVGASDDLASGQSTFMVEMNEVSNILRNATSKSLLILDEIGRGTSTFDGLSIAWAVVEHIANTRLLGAKTLFATHYHELTELEGRMNNVKNFSIAVKEQGDDIVFLRKIVKGGADKSYGIQVAKLAGVPDMVIDRAKEIVNQLVDNDILEKVQSIEIKSNNSGKTKNSVEHYDEVDLAQMSLFDTVSDEDVINELKELELTAMTPIDALNTLYKLQNKLNNRFSFD